MSQIDNIVEVAIHPVLARVEEELKKVDLPYRKKFYQAVVHSQLEALFGALGVPERVASVIRKERYELYKNWFEDGKNDPAAKAVETALAISFSCIITAI